MACLPRCAIRRRRAMESCRPSGCPMLRLGSPAFGLAASRDDVPAPPENTEALLRDVAFSSLRPPQPHPLPSALAGVGAAGAFGRSRSLCARVRSAPAGAATPTLPRAVMARRLATDASRPFDGAAEEAAKRLPTGAAGSGADGCAAVAPCGTEAGRLAALRTPPPDVPPAPCWECARRRSRARRLPSCMLGVIACAMEKLSLGYGFQFTADP